MDLSEILKQDATAILRFLDQNAGTLTDVEKKRLTDAIEQKQTESPSAEQDLARQEADETVEANAYDEALEAAAEEVARRRMSARAGGGPLELDDIREMAPEDLSPVEQEQFAREADARGREMAVEAEKGEHITRGEDEATASQLAEEGQSILDEEAVGSTPRWILQQNGAELTDEQKQRAVDYWNDLYGTWAIIRDFDNLAPLLEDSTEVAQHVVQAALLDVDPIEAIQVALPGDPDRDPFTLRSDVVEAARQRYGLSNDALIRLVRLSSFYDDDDTPIDELWQPMAALMAASGRIDQMAAEEAERQSGLAPEAEDGGGAGPPSRSRASDTQHARAKGVDPEALDEVAARNDPDQVPSYLRGDDIVSDPEAGIDPTFAAFGNLRMYYREGLDIYNGDTYLAFLHTLDRGLAARLAASGGDPGKIAGADNAEAVRLLQKGGLVDRGSSPFESIGGSLNSTIRPYLQDYFESLKTEEDLKAEQEAERAGAPRAMPDPVAIAEQVRNLWVNLFRTEPSADLVSAFQQELEGAINAAPMEQNVDVTARIQAWVRGQPIYGQLYGNKPEGVTEQEYQGQFLAGAQSLLGNELPPEEAILAGMRDGEYQTTIGAVTGSKSSLDNSTFRERLARAASSLDEMT